MIVTRISEIVHGWLGWCPNQGMATSRKKIIPWPEMNSLALQAQGAYVDDEVIVDYGATGVSLKFFLGALIGILGIAAFLLLIPRVAVFPLAGIFFCGLILLVTIIMIFQDLKKARLEITPDTLVIRRFLHGPVVIHKDLITTVEVCPNVRPLPLRLLKVLIFIVIPASSAGVLYGEYLQLTAGDITSLSFFLHLGFDISIVLFFLGIYYHSRIRATFPEILVITTTTKKLAGIYGKNPEEIAKKLGKLV
jgi:hypothetical protein